LHLDRDTVLEIGRLGKISFRAGCYIYIGRARRNLRQRISRHLRGGGPLRWHIDYLRRKAAGASDCRCPGHLTWFEVRPQHLSGFKEIDPEILLAHSGCRS